MSAVWAATLLAGAGTYAMRASFLAVAGRFETVPPVLARVLRQIPPAALASLILPAFVRPDDALAPGRPELWVGLLASVVAWRTRNVALTLVVGLGALGAARALGWA